MSRSDIQDVETIGSKGTPSDEALLHAPANLPIMVTTAPFDTSICTRQVPSWWTETPPSMLPEASKPRKDSKYKVPTAGPMITIRSVGGDGTETVPSWRMIKESDDIAESTSKGGRTTRGVRGGGRDGDEVSPIIIWLSLLADLGKITVLEPVGT